MSEEAEFADDYQPEYGMAQARADGLALFLGSDIGSLAPPAAARLGQAAERVVRSLPAAKGRQGRGLYVHLRTSRIVPPDEDAPGSIEPWEAVTSVWPDTAQVRSLRLLDGMG